MFFKRLFCFHRYRMFAGRWINGHFIIYKECEKCGKIIEVEKDW